MGILFAFAQAIAWALSTMVLRNLSAQLDALLVNGIRAAFALLIIAPLIVILGASGDYALMTPLRLAYLIGSVLIGGVAGDFFLLTSLRLLGISRAFPITNSYPLFTVLLSALLLGAPMTWQILVGMALVLVGVYLVARPSTPSSGQPDQASLPVSSLIKGVACGLATAVLWGLATIILSLGLRGEINSVVATSVRVLAVALFSTVLAIWRGAASEIGTIRRKTWILLGVAGVLGWGIAGSLYAAAVQFAGPSQAAIIGATAPIFAIPLSWAFYRERPTRASLAGTLLSIAGVILVV
ncbi:MAG: DMT family transporter [Anaerolineae bacterium]|nr:DMT family transporter [Anaerolineae bacterium]